MRICRTGGGGRRRGRRRWEEEREEEVGEEWRERDEVRGVRGGRKDREEEEDERGRCGWKGRDEERGNGETFDGRSRGGNIGGWRREEQRKERGITQKTEVSKGRRRDRQLMMGRK